MPIQTPQWTEFLSCPICCNVFNETSHRPTSLGCGHTVCKTCLSKLHQKKCPFDQSQITRKIDELPANYALLQLVGVAAPKADNCGSVKTSLAENVKYYESAVRCIEDLAVYLKPVPAGMFLLMSHSLAWATFCWDEIMSLSQQGVIWLSLGLHTINTKRRILARISKIPVQNIYRIFTRIRRTRI